MGFSAPLLATPAALFGALMCSVADQLSIEPAAEEDWRNGRSPGANFERYLVRHVIRDDPAPLVWAVDEADRLFSCPFRSDVFGLMRSWHNARALDADGPWRCLTVLIAYASDAALFIPDANQSPFNVGTPIRLAEFGRPEVEELNRRYGGPLRSSSEIDAIMALVGGHPYLVRRALHALVSTDIGLDALCAVADTEDGPFGDHLDRMLAAVQHDPILADAIRALLRGDRVAPEILARLRAAGWVDGSASGAPSLRCRLYERYLAKHLAGGS